MANDNHRAKPGTAANHRIALGVEYNGAAYHGWQRQDKPAVPTVQAAVEQALAHVADHSVSVVCAGRTDAGVHATEQVVHFDTDAKRPLSAWVKGSNSQLPANVRIRWSTDVPDDFHARFSATARRYRYFIYNEAVRSGLFAAQLTHQPHALDVELMHREAQCLLGEQDFSAFRAVACQSNTPMRNVHHVKVFRHGPCVVVDIEANAFLLHMVRNIVGTLMRVGTGQESPGWTAWLMSQRDRTLAAATAPAAGLYLVGVNYPSHFALPQSPLGPLFLSGVV